MSPGYCQLRTNGYSNSIGQKEGLSRRVPEACSAHFFTIRSKSNPDRSAEDSEALFSVESDIHDWPVNCVPTSPQLATYCHRAILPAKIGGAC